MQCSKHPVQSLAALMLCLAMFVLSSPLAAGTPKERKNIDDLTPTELANYEAAVRILKSRDSRNRLNPALNATEPSYEYLASLHNSHCVHNTPRFLLWHRAVLYYYERALQATAPQHADVTLPYWAWTDPEPSGGRYPQPFQDPTSVLYDERRDNHACGTTYSTTCGPITVTCPHISFDFMAMQSLSSTTWPEISGQVQAGGRVVGSLEVPHNTMHHVIGGVGAAAHGGQCNPFSGGDMWNLSTAANDPIFWSFHAYLDQLFDYWQQENPSVTYDIPRNGGYPGMTEQQFGALFLMDSSSQPWWTVPSGPNPTRVRDVLHSSQLGYFYEETPDESSPLLSCPPREGLFASLAPGVAAMATQAEPETVHSFDFKIPVAGFHHAELVLGKVVLPKDFSYTAHVYIHPKSVQYKPGDPGFSKYQVNNYTLLRTHHHESEPLALVFDVTGELTRLARFAAGADYVVTVACDGFGSDGTIPSAAQLEAQTAIGSFSVELKR